MPLTDLKGVYNITPTPFQPGGALDLESLRRLTRMPAFPLDEGTARDLRELLARLSLLVVNPA